MEKRDKILASVTIVVTLVFILFFGLTAKKDNSRNNYEDSSKISVEKNSEDDSENGYSKSESIISSVSSSEVSSSSTDSISYEEKVNKLSYGTVQSAKYNKDTNTLTYTGFEAWSDYSNDDLQHAMDILETIANKQAVHYGMHNPAIDVVLPNGKLIASSNGKDDIEFVE